MTDDEINAAVAWWVATLRDSPTGNAPTEPQLQAFADHLSASLRSPDVATYLKGILSCHDSPEGLLLDAAKSAGIDPLRFPSKVAMWLGSHYVIVKVGYGDSVTRVYPPAQD